MICSKSFTRFALGVAVLGLSVSPVLAQSDPATPPAASPTEPSQPDSGLPGGVPGNVTNGPTSGSDNDVMDDSKVFGFDITMGTANLTDEQKLAARNTCNESVMTNPTRYSTNVKTFCQQME